MSVIANETNQAALTTLLIYTCEQIFHTTGKAHTTHTHTQLNMNSGSMNKSWYQHSGAQHF